MLPKDSTFFLNKAFAKTIDRLIKLFKGAMRSFLIEPVVPVYIAWFFYVFIPYLMPWLLGYSVMDTPWFPFESKFARGVTNLVSYFPG